MVLTHLLHSQESCHIDSNAGQTVTACDNVCMLHERKPSSAYTDACMPRAYTDAEMAF